MFNFVVFRLLQGNELPFEQKLPDLHTDSLDITGESSATFANICKLVIIIIIVSWCIKNSSVPLYESFAECTFNESQELQFTYLKSVVCNFVLYYVINYKLCMYKVFKINIIQFW